MCHVQYYFNAFIAATFLILFLSVGYVILNSLPPTEAKLLSTEWEEVERDVKNRIYSDGFVFLAHAHEWQYTIPAIENTEYEECFSNHAELDFVKHDTNFGPDATNRNDMSEEYMFKYNEIVKIQILDAGITCENL